jgi:hypothetical protein
MDRVEYPPGRVPGNLAGGRQVTVPGFVFYRIISGKTAEFRGLFDVGWRRA